MGIGPNPQSPYKLLNHFLIVFEDQIAKLTDENEIDKFITTPVINDDKFFNKKLQDIISGNNYKELVNQDARKWIMDKKGPRPPHGISKIPTLNDALKIYEQEKKKRENKHVLLSQVEECQEGEEKCLD